MPIPEVDHRSFHPDLQIAMTAAQAAANEIRHELAGVTLSNVQVKGVGDFVTKADQLADAAICNNLRVTRPKYGIISEELHPDAKAVDRTWIIDPLDATSSVIFRTGNEMPSVMIALKEFGKTTLAVVTFPLTEEWFWAVSGKGAYKGAKRISVPESLQAVRLNDAWIDMNQYGDAMLESVTFARLRKKLRSKDGAKLVTSLPPHSGVAVRIAEGARCPAAVIHDNHRDHVKQAIWDVEAPKLIIEEAGGSYSYVRSARPYDALQPGPIIAAASRALVLQVKQLLESN